MTLSIALAIILSVTPICAVFGVISYFNYRLIRSLTHAVVAKNNVEYHTLEAPNKPSTQPSQQPNDEPVFDADQLSDEQWDELLRPL